jgi:hypothetical protein
MDSGTDVHPEYSTFRTDIFQFIDLTHFRRFPLPSVFYK